MLFTRLVRSARSATGNAPAATVAHAARQQIDLTQQNARVVSGKTFFQNGPHWIDGESQQRQAAKTVKVQFASEDYFRLLAEKPEAAAWMALGRNVQFTLGDTLYDVTE